MILCAARPRPHSAGDTAGARSSGGRPPSRAAERGGLEGRPKHEGAAGGAPPRRAHVQLLWLWTALQQGTRVHVRWVWAGYVGRLPASRSTARSRKLSRVQARCPSCEAKTNACLPFHACLPFPHRSVGRSVGPPARPPARPPACLPACPAAYLCLCLSVSICVAVCPCVHVFVRLCV